MQHQAKRSGRFFPVCRILFIVLLTVFFAVGFFTLGSFHGTGKTYTYTYENDAVASFDLSPASGKKLSYVYLNVGNIYVAPGDDVLITVKRASYSGSKPSTTVGAVRIANIYSKNAAGKEGANFNWISVLATDSGQESVGVSAACISISATKNFDLNEVVCLDNEGNQISLSVNTDYSVGINKGDLKNAIDAPKSFSKSSSVYHNFTSEEAYYMTSITSVLDNVAARNDSVYTVDGDFNSLATVLMLPSVAMFGRSPFALRLPSLIATAASILFIYLIAARLFKDEKYALIFAFLFAVGGIGATVGRLGAPYALLTCCLLGSLSFMYKFFAKGISSKHIIRGGMNVFLSGLFAAAAMSMNVLTAVPVLGILVLFVFGLIRQKKAYAYETTKLAEESGEEARQLKAAYRYKTKVSVGFAIASFVVVAFLLTLLASVVTYSSYVRAYEQRPTAPVLGYGTLLWKGISAPFNVSNITKFTEQNAANALTYLLPLNTATLYDGVYAIGVSRYLNQSVLLNPVVGVLALLSVFYATFTVIFEWCGKERGSKENKRTRRAWLVLFTGLVLSMLSIAFVKNVSLVQSLTLNVFYIGFIPLTLKLMSPKEKGKGKTVFAWIEGICLVACAVFFGLAVPTLYGFSVSKKAAEGLFVWMSIQGMIG